MAGFFSKQQTASPYLSEKGMHSCASCQLYKQVKTPRMQPYGNFKKQIMVIGESPGREDDEKGGLWHGPMGQLLRRTYKSLGVDVFEDCLSLSAVNCRAINKRDKNNRVPTDYEISCCRPKILTEIKKHKPKVIILHGNSAISCAIGHRWKRDQGGGIGKWAGWAIPDREFNAWLCPTFHPSFIEHQQDQDGEVKVWWARDLAQAFAKVKEPLPTYKNEADCVEISMDVEGVLDKIRKKGPPLLAFDIEATGLKSYNTNIHETVATSFCYEDDRAYAIPAPSTAKQMKRLKLLLEHQSIGKIAANMKYEDNWMSILHGINISPWAFDTMQAAHILDNRPGITSLKFQAYVRFGVLGYDDEITPYLKAEDSMSTNKIKELVKNKASFEKLLLYNGIDSLLTYRLAKIQMKEIEEMA